MVMDLKKKSALDTTQRIDADHSIEGVCSEVWLMHCEAAELLWPLTVPSSGFCDLEGPHR